MEFTLYEVLALINLFLPPLTYLVYIQSMNIILNTTTNMRFNKFKRVMHNDIGASNEFIENLIVEQKDESIDYNTYNTFQSNN